MQSDTLYPLTTFNGIWYTLISIFWIYGNSYQYFRISLWYLSLQDEMSYDDITQHHILLTCASNTLPVWQMLDGSHSTNPCEMSYVWVNWLTYNIMYWWTAYLFLYSLQLQLDIVPTVSWLYVIFIPQYWQYFNWCLCATTVKLYMRKFWFFVG